MSIFESFIIALIRGATQILPISGSGHSILIIQILGLEKPSAGFDLVCNLGLILAIVLALRKDIFTLIKKPFLRARFTLVALVPAMIFYIVIQVFFSALFTEKYLVYGFLLTAILLLIAGFAPQKSRHDTKNSYFDAFIIGVTQGLSILPGLSASGSAVASGALLGLDGKTSARFSFVIFIPLLILNSVIDIATNGIGASVELLSLFIGFVTTFASAFFAIKLLLKILEKFNLDFFAIYLFILSIAILLNNYLIHLF